ncbi:sce7726 family protein [Amphibacillus indicireducens]|uniref:Sce7726 family protein n=1 Tax=Amphibacillus indicireducens TaxID=1076330 RepID=A0ABP7VKH5_9BACI
MINKNINYFDYAQLLFKNYSTALSDERIKDNIFNIFEGNISPDFFVENNIEPRVFINDYLLRHYPNETTIKASFINHVLLKSKNHVTVFELNVGGSRLDLCKINGTSIAYEIKTELDSPVRLESQMTDYFKTFEKVYLICSEKNLDKMYDKVPKECGIYTYYLTKTGRYVFKKKRNATKSNRISPEIQLGTLTKRDLETYFNCENESSKDSMIEKIGVAYSNKEINQLFKRCLRNKFSDKWAFLLDNQANILEIDYQWFYKNSIAPEIVYQ